MLIRAFLFGVVCTSLFGQSVPPAKEAPKVVFVCEHGAAKSIIAAAEFNKRAQEAGLSERAISRGTNPDPVFAPGVMEGLKKDGFSAPAGVPRRIADGDVQSADRVITLGCKLPDRLDAKAKPVDWSDISSPSANYDAARKDISRHVEALVNELLKEKAKK